MTALSIVSPASPLDYALAYAALGWYVLPVHSVTSTGTCTCGRADCLSPGKHPIGSLTPHGLSEASREAAQLERWWTRRPDAGIAIRTGRESGVVAVDIDSGARGGDETWKAISEGHDVPATVEAITGGGGRHLLFAYPRDAAHVITGKDTLGPGIDTRGDRGYIVVEPSRHRSGRTYLWEASSSPLDDAALAPLPAWLVERIETQAAQPAAPSPDQIPLLPAARVQELRSALAFIPSDERDVWLRVGMALHNEQAGPQGFGLWVEWSQASEKYNARDQRYTWDHFSDRPDGVTAASLFDMARANGWVEPVALVSPTVREFSSSAARGSLPELQDVPRELLTPPGVLADIAAYGLASSVRPVPIFAVQAALALGSVVCARRYMTTQRNYASCYFLNVAKSGTGKEEAKTTIENLLTAAGVRRLVGGSSYTSGNAVYSALLRKPQHLVILDEFGKYMEAAAATRDSYRADALTMLMEAFGRAHGDMSTPQFSTMSLSQKQAADMEPRIISRPAITLLALATPSSFYGALTSTRVLDGFLNRFLIAEYAGPRTPMRDWQDVPVPELAVRWIQQVLASRGDLDELMRVDLLPEPVIVPLTDAALRLSHGFEREMLQVAERLDTSGLGDMAIRTREIGLRLGLITALATDPETPLITDDLLAWCFAYVRHFLGQTVGALRERLADSETEKARNTVLAAIVAAGEKGLTNKELHRCKPVMAIPKRMRQEALDALMQAELIASVELPTGGRGRPRHAWTAVSDCGEEGS